MSFNLPFKSINEFSLHEVIQDGPYTIIVRGYQKNLKRDVLVKLLKPHSSAELKDRFDREARVYAKLNHPNIVSVYALGEIKNYLYIILEFIDGCSLKTMLENKSIPQNSVWDIAYYILDALKHASTKKVVHRDIKPANIMIDSDGNVKVTDFGLALISDEPNITKQQALIGTPAYMSPEQITGDVPDIRSDIFSFGSLLYEMIYRKQAFGHDNFSASINSILNDRPEMLDKKTDIPQDLSTFLEKCLQKDRDKRWNSIEEVLNAWQNLKGVLKSVDPGQNIKSLVLDLRTKTRQSEAETKILASVKFFKISRLLPVIAVLLILLVILFFPKETKIPQQESLPPDTIKVAEKSIAVDNDSLLTEQLTGQTDNKNVAVNNRLKTAKSTATAKDESADTFITKKPVVEKAILQLDIVPWAKVYLDDSLIDTHLVKMDFELQAARYTIRMEHPRFETEIQVVDLTPGEKKNVHWSFWEKTGFLDVQVRPWAEVYINNEYFDTTPFKKPLQLPAGTQVLELRHPALASYKELITIVANDTLVIKKNMNDKNGTVFEPAN